MKRFAGKFAISAACCAGVLWFPGLGAEALGRELYGTLRKINDTNTIVVGHRESSVPFSYINDKKQPVGYAIDICNKIVDEIKKTLEKPNLQVTYMVVTPQNRISLVANHTVDMECGSTTNTLARQEQVDFSAIYFTTGTRVLVRKMIKAKEIEKLQGKSIGVIGGSTNQRAINAIIDAGRLKNTRLVEFKDYAAAQAALEASNVDAFATDDIVLFGLISKSSIRSELEVIGRFLTYDPYGIMTRRDDSAFRLIVNKTMAALFRSGEIEKIYGKWFDPIGVPISELTRAGFALQALPE